MNRVIFMAMQMLDFAVRVPIVAARLCHARVSTSRSSLPNKRVVRLKAAPAICIPGITGQLCVDLFRTTPSSTSSIAVPWPLD
jgi:hypothetical protein